METWIVVVEWLARLILLTLILLSVWSVTIILDRRKRFQTFAKEDGQNNIWNKLRENQKSEIETFAQGTGLKSQTVKICLGLKEPEQIDRAVSSYLQTQKRDLEKGLAILGTLGSTTPFVGLLGTILGIIVAFGALSTGKIDSQKIMYALAEALILTAVGLAVAIPAVVAFNAFNKKMLSHLKECENLKDQFIAYVLGR